MREEMEEKEEEEEVVEEKGTGKSIVALVRSVHWEWRMNSNL